MGPALAWTPLNVSASIDITYAAHTATCTFLLDSEGICRRIVLAPGNQRSPQPKTSRDATRLAARCVGAQYVASLDPSVSGMLAERPRVGASMLFARIDERGRVSLVRTGIVTQFECLRNEDPFEDSDKAPSMSVETSAPVIAPSPPTPRVPRQTALPPPDPYYADGNDRTRPIQALRPQDFRLHSDDASMAQTTEFRPEGNRRPTWPSPGRATPPPLPHLRPSPTLVASNDDGAVHPSPPRPIHPLQPRRIPRTTDPARPRAAVYPVDKVAGRGRGDH
jgi:hypothetical protein